MSSDGKVSDCRNAPPMRSWCSMCALQRFSDCLYVRDSERGSARLAGEEPFPLDDEDGPRPTLPITAADVLAIMERTFRERNKVYGDNFRMIGPMMKILFPQGVSPKLLHSDQFHLFELILVKLSRFAVSGLKHKDSIHDSAVYGAMIEAILNEQDLNHRR